MSDIYLSLTETPSVVTLSQPVISSSVAATVTVANTVTVALDANSLSALENVTVTVGAAVSVSNFPASQTISGTVTVGNATTASAVAVRLIAEDTNPGGSPAGVNVNLYSNDNALLVDALKNGNSVLGYDGFSSYVQVKPAVGSSVTIGSLPAISGTVTANGGDGTFLVGGLRGGSKTAFPMDVGTGYLQTKVESMPAISGTVSATVTIGVVSQGCFGATIQGYDTLTGVSFGNCVPVKLFEDGTGLIGNVAGTVTANNPSGALTTRFGSVTTANTAQLTSAVTNTSRKYLLVQNIATSTVTIGIGFAPTTTQGIQLMAGAGLTFDAFCPTGGVWWLSSTTGSNFSILEG
jgi:hypothetical protein